MVAIIKFIISAALMSQVSALAIGQLPTSTVIVSDPVSTIRPEDSADATETPAVAAQRKVAVPDAIVADSIHGKLVLGAPVLAVDTPDVDEPKIGARALLSSVEGEGILGKVVVGLPVLAVRKNVIAVPSVVQIRAVETTPVVPATVSATGALGNLVVGFPVLAVRPGKVVKTTTLATSALKSVPTGVSL